MDDGGHCVPIVIDTAPALNDIYWDLEIMVDFEVCGNTYDKARED